MSYSVFIKKDYKPVVRWVPDTPWYQRPRMWLLALISLTPLILIHTIIASTDPLPESQVYREINANTPIEFPSPLDETSGTAVDKNGNETLIQFSSPAVTMAEEIESNKWQNIKVAKGENLSLIFDRLGISSTVLYEVLASGSETSALKRLLPHQELHFLIKNGELLALKYDLDLTRTLQVENENNRFTSRLITTPLTTTIKKTDAVIDSSLFLAGQNAGLSDNIIMQLVAIYGWDIDFALDIRAGDQFKIVYEEHYKDDTKVSEGPILAAEFINRGKVFRAVRYANTNGDADYFSDSGASMRKAFLRTPLNFTRVSSHFNLQRKHPVLNTIRAHKGVDYSAPNGTPIKATGDGTIIYLGRKGGYGNTVILKHGGNYSTLYAHLSRYASSLRQGSKVRQGQIIGYTGMTGLATGPHLHYEFRVNGVHRNPLTVKLPKADSIPHSQIAEFRSRTGPLLAQLDDKFDNRKKIVLALGESAVVEPSSPIPSNY